MSYLTYVGPVYEIPLINDKVRIEVALEPTGVVKWGLDSGENTAFNSLRGAKGTEPVVLNCVERDHALILVSDALSMHLGHRVDITQVETEHGGLVTRVFQDLRTVASASRR